METSIKFSFHGSFIKELKIQKLYASFVKSSMRFFIPKATFSDFEKTCYMGKPGPFVTILQYFEIVYNTGQFDDNLAKRTGVPRTPFSSLCVKSQCYQFDRIH